MGVYKRIIVGSDGSDTSLLAVDRAAAIAAASEAELLVVAAYEPADTVEVASASDALKADAFQVVGSAPAESTLRDAADRAREAGARKVDTLAVQGAPIKVLDGAVTDCDADLLVVGNVGLNTLTGRILGSVPSGVAAGQVWTYL